jgi:hypothetical protein
MIFYATFLRFLRLTGERIFFHERHEATETIMNNEYNLTYVRWAARVLAAALFVQVVGYAYCVVADASSLAGGLKALLRASNGTPFLILIMAGLIVSWKREGLGGTLMTAGVLGFYLFCYCAKAVIVGVSFIFWPGVLFMLYAFATKRYRLT